MRAAIVTGGAGGGIGSGIVTTLVGAAWSVLIVDRDEARAATLCERLAGQPGRAEFLGLDIVAPDAPEAAVRCALERFGRLDGLVNNAGVGLVAKLGEIDDAAYDRLFDIDFRAVFRFTRAALPALIQTRGAVVNVGSIQALAAHEGYALYAAAKAGVEALTRGIAVDYGPQGVRANCIHPGLVPSPQNDALIARFTDDPQAWVAGYARTKQAVPNLVDADQVGRLTLFLLDPANAGLTGQAIALDGGTTALLYDREPER